MTPAPMTPQRSYAMPGMWVSEYTLQAPLDWHHPDGEQLQLFIRELVDPDRRDVDLPLATYLQGGPGGANPRPLTGTGGWLGEALEHYRVVLVDQRGTGRSTPVEADDVAALGSPAAGAEYLAKFRADSIVRDLEHVRHHLYGGRKWVTIGQSFGGFITLTYLSHAPEALAASYIFGGTPGLPPDAAEVYRRTFTRVEQKTTEFYRRYPQAVDTVAQIADHLATHEVRLPDGDHLTVRRLQTLGRDLGMKPGHERLHWLLETAFSRPGRLSDGFLEQVQLRTSSAGNPLYWTLQESIYADDASGPTNWAAQRERDRRPQFAEDRRPLLFTGEMAFPWMFQEIGALRGFAPAVAELARRQTWSPLYEIDRLADNDVPVAAAVYYEDMYVDAHLQLGTLAKVGNSQYWVTNEHEHDGVTSEGTFAYLRDLVRDRGGEHW